MTVSSGSAAVTAPMVTGVGHPDQDRSWRPVVTRLAWVVVVSMALAVSWWSLYGLARHYGVPVVLAAGVSLVFDAAALVAADLAHRYACSPYSGAGPRLTMIALLGGSVYLNWTHAAQLAHYGTPGAVIFAAPAAVALVLFELERGWATREARHARGRVAPPLPVLGRWSWLLHTGRSIRTIWLVTGAHVDSIRAVELARYRATLAATVAATDPTQPATTTAPTTPVTSAPVVATAPAAGEPADPVTMAGPPGQPVHDDRPPGQAGDRTRAILTGMAYDAERVRYAASELRGHRPVDVRTVQAYLTEHGQTVQTETIRSTLRRLRPAPDQAHEVVRLDSRRPAGAVTTLV